MARKKEGTGNNSLQEESAAEKKFTEPVAYYVKPVEKGILIRSTSEFYMDNRNVCGELKGQEAVPVVRAENGYGKLPDGYFDGIKTEAWIQLCFTKRCS